MSTPRRRRLLPLPHLLLIPLAATLLLAGCATEKRPTCRRVSAQEFMRPHTFKDLPSDQFIGVTKSWPGSKNGPERAFKQVFVLGWFTSWEILWCPVQELPASYLKQAHEKPYVKAPGQSDLPPQ